MPGPRANARPTRRLVRTEHLGAELLLHLVLADGQRVIVRQDPVVQGRAGDRLHLRVPAGKLLLFDEHGGDAASRDASP